MHAKFAGLLQTVPHRPGDQNRTQKQDSRRGSCIKNVMVIKNITVALEWLTKGMLHWNYISPVSRFIGWLTK